MILVLIMLFSVVLLVFIYDFNYVVMSNNDIGEM